jgi:hypothetical protein
MAQSQCDSHARPREGVTARRTPPHLRLHTDDGAKNCVVRAGSRCILEHRSKLDGVTTILVAGLAKGVARRLLLPEALMYQGPVVVLHQDSAPGDHHGDVAPITRQATHKSNSAEGVERYAGAV